MIKPFRVCTAYSAKFLIFISNSSSTRLLGVKIVSSMNDNRKKTLETRPIIFEIIQIIVRIIIVDSPSFVSTRLMGDRLGKSDALGFFKLQKIIFVFNNNNKLSNSR